MDKHLELLKSVYKFKYGSLIGQQKNSSGHEDKRNVHFQPEQVCV